MSRQPKLYSGNREITPERKPDGYMGPVALAWLRTPKYNPPAREFQDIIALRKSFAATGEIGRAHV